LWPRDTGRDHGDDLVSDLQIPDQGVILPSPILLTQVGQFIVGRDAIKDPLIGIPKVNVLIKWLEQFLLCLDSAVRIEIGIPFLYADDVQALPTDPIPPGQHFHLGIPLLAFIAIYLLSPYFQATGHAS